jgi:hypothetical protein
MPLTFIERDDSRESSNDEITLHYHLTGTASDVAARSIVLTSTASTYQGLVRQTVELKPIWIDITAQGGVGDGRWDVFVRYGLKANASDTGTGDATIEFDTTGGTQHITQGMQPFGEYACKDESVESFFGAIGVTGSGSSRTVEGVDIVVPAFKWSETHYLTDAVVQSKKATWYTLTGKTNSEVWRGYAIGEVLYLGVTGRKRGVDSWEVTFSFAASPNVADACADWPTDIKPSSAVPKTGWQTMSVYYREAAGDTNILPKPIQVCINTVYKSGALSGLGIGT